MKTTFSLALIALVMATTLFSCRKAREREFGNGISTDDGTAENLFGDVFKVVDEVSASTAGIRENEIGCIDTIIVDTLSSPKSITIDFGNDDCEGNDGRTRKGVLFITYTGRYREVGSVITITPENYTVDGYSIEGVKVIENLGLNDSGQLHYAITVDGMITAPNDEWDITWTANRIRTWVEGQSTPTIWDDAYLISGSGSGINRNDVEYTTNITVPLRAEVGCRWIVSGALTIVPQGYSQRYIDFGNGECNNGIFVTVNGDTYTLGTE
ncbi:MAG: hypothetical protein ACK478_08710 [Flavobacteriales bacterium]|jgi:hypothetical protein